MLDSSPFRRPEHDRQRPVSRGVPGWFWGALIGVFMGLLLGTGAGLLIGKAIWSGKDEGPRAGHDDAKPKTTETKKPVGPPKVDVMLVVDVTGSMDLRQIESNVEDLVRRMKDDKLDVRIGLTIFRDEFSPDPGDGVMADPWAFTFASGAHYTPDAKEVRDALSRLRANGGGDGPENSFEGLRRAAEVAAREDALKIQILVTDAEPKPWPNYEDNLRVTKTFLQDKNVRQCHVICVPAYRTVYEQLWNPARDPRTERAILSGSFFDLKSGDLSRTFDEIRGKVLEETRP